jgi:hypothetical protein
MTRPHRPTRDRARRPRRRIATVLSALLVAAGLLVLAPTAAQAWGCTAPPCGAITNNSDWDLPIRWTDNNGAWKYGFVQPGETKGGWSTDSSKRLDVDYFQVPYGCVAVGGLPHGSSLPYYGPTGWDKINNFETVRIDRISCRDGYVYAWASAADAWESASEGQQACRFYDDDGNWGDNCGGYRNIASTVQNNSSGGNVVKFFFHTNYTGAYACLGPKDAWRNLAAGIYFSFSPGLDGYGRNANDEIAGHKWARTCS